MIRECIDCTIDKFEIFLVGKHTFKISFKEIGHTLYFKVAIQIPASQNMTCFYDLFGELFPSHYINVDSLLSIFAPHTLG